MGSKKLVRLLIVGRTYHDGGDDDDDDDASDVGGGCGDGVGLAVKLER